MKNDSFASHDSIEFDRANMTRDMRWKVADWLAEDRLPQINATTCEIYPEKGFYLCFGKRCFDIVISLIALIITCPVNLIIGVITFLDVGRPIFFRQKRSGYKGKDFELVKFRNMKNTRDSKGELLPASKRVTKWGKFVRKTSLDELLNFWSVLKGDMSIIGPRPLPPEYLKRYSKRHLSRLQVRPGLECPPRKLTGHRPTWQEQFENDIWYVEHVSFKTDFKMMIQLFRFALDRKSAKARAEVNDKGIFMGYSEYGIAINLEQVPQEYIIKSFKIYE